MIKVEFNKKCSLTLFTSDVFIGDVDDKANASLIIKFLAWLDYRARIYETHRGLRFIVLSHNIPAGQYHQLLTLCDKRYQKMVSFGYYRARLEPKPELLNLGRYFYLQRHLVIDSGQALFSKLLQSRSVCRFICEVNPLLDETSSARVVRTIHDAITVTGKELA
jgi:hypothetical protein